MAGKLYIGTSGYSYPHWENGVFYPKGLPKSGQLEYYAWHFNTVEMNYPFYRLPSSKSFSIWKETVPKDFVFAIKVSRYITHVKYLHRVKTAWKTFFKRALHLEQKLGPFLFQLPPSFKANKENIQRLEDFLKILRGRTSSGGPTSKNLKFAFEFRHKTWCDKKIYDLLKKYKMAWVIANSPCYPRADVTTADFVYIRMHGGKVLYTSNYSEKELKDWAEKIKGYFKKGLDVYVYFNNDACGYAIDNAKSLSGFFK